MTSPSKEDDTDVWAWTPDYNLIIVLDSDEEPLYGIQNRHTSVIEIQEPVFSNAVNYMIEIQEAFDAVSALIGEDGGIMIDDVIKVTYKTKKEYH